MGLLTEGYRLAMQHYSQLQQNQEAMKSVQEELTKIEEGQKVEQNTPVEKPNKKEESFDKIVENVISNISSGQTYNVGGYNITIPALSNNGVKESIKRHNIDGIITMASEKYDIPEALLYKIIETESYFNNDVISSAGATGLMQIMPFNNESLGISNAKDPYQNIMGGTKLLKQYLNMYDGDLKLGLAAYNAGPGNVNKYGGVPPFNETQNYIRKILGVEP